MKSVLRQVATLAAGAALVLGVAGGALAHPVALSGYQVEPGDTLYAIAARELGSGTRWKELAALNGLTDGAGIRPGQVLRLPADGAAAARRRPKRDAVVPAAEPQTDEARTAPAGDVRIGHGYEASPSPRHHRHFERGIEIVPKGRVVMVLPAPQMRIRHAARSERPVDGAELPALPHSEPSSPWKLADGMAFLVGAGGTFIFLSRGMRKLLTKGAGQRR